MRSRVEQYDLKNSELIQRSGYDSIAFTESKWVGLTETIQDLKVQTSLMNRSKMYFAGLQRHFIMMALVDCALAKLIAVAKIFSADIYVYARAIENMIDLVLMRSRAESELASMGTSIEVLTDLKAIWEQSGDRDLLSCSLDSANGSEETQGVLKVKGLAYTRGSASVRQNLLSIYEIITYVTISHLHFLVPPGPTRRSLTFTRNLRSDWSKWIRQKHFISTFNGL